MSKKILIIEDEDKILQLQKNYLEKEMFNVITAADGKQGLSKALAENPDLIVLDLMLPEMDGLDVCREIRKNNRTPIIMVTAKIQEIDKLVGLELGADDYITKPFSLAELTARIKAVLRRTNDDKGFNTNTVEHSGFKLDMDKYELFVNDVLVALTPTEMNILSLLMRNPGRVYSRLQLLEFATSDAYEGYERSIDTHINNIRKKVEANPSSPQHLVTIYGVGYKFRGN